MNGRELVNACVDSRTKAAAKTPKYGEYHAPGITCPKCGGHYVDEQGSCEECGMDLSSDILAYRIDRAVDEAKDANCG